MSGERPRRPVLRHWERRIGCRPDRVVRAFDPVKEICRRLPPNDQLEARSDPVTSDRSLAGPFTPSCAALARRARGLRLIPTSGA
jgi:hypothetical protein